MAKLSSIKKNNFRKKLAAQFSARRSKLKAVVMNRASAPDERFKAQVKLAVLPRNSAPTRVRNRCAITGRARGNYRKFGISRIMFREMAAQGLIPGVTKASW